MTFEGGDGDKKEKTPPSERIVSAASKYKGEIFTGRWHWEAWNKLRKKYPEDWERLTSNDEQYLKDFVDGFITSTGRFIDREEAKRIAEDADQLPKDIPGSELAAEELGKKE